LKRHIGVHYGLTPDEFRAKWGLAYDYSMAAPAAWQVYCALCLLACAAIAQRKANAAASHAVRDGPLAKSTASAIGMA
jgi:predicted transcriptional regulator